MPHCHDELYRFFFYANYVFVALHVACIRGDRGRTGCDRHRGGATAARERLQVGPSRDGRRSYFTIAFSQTITTPPFYRRKLPFSMVARLDPKRERVVGPQLASHAERRAESVQ